MSTEENQDVVTDDIGDGEGSGQSAEEIKLSKAEYEELVGHKSTVGSLKRELKDLKKQLEDKVQGSKETPKNQTEEFGLLQETYLRTAGKLETDEEIELAKTIQKETGMPWNKLVSSKYFTTELEGHRATKANAKATNVDGGSGSSGGAKDSPDYWSQKGDLPDAKDVPDRKVRANIIREVAKRTRGGGGGKFYNE